VLLLGLASVLSVVHSRLSPPTPIKAVPRPAAVHPTMPSANNVNRNAPRTGHLDDYEERFFDQKNGWTPLYDKYPWTQRYRLVPVPGSKTLLYSESTLLIHADKEDISEALRQPWDWWLHGRYADRVQHTDGTIDFTMAPVYTALTTKYKMFKPEHLPNGHVRLRLELSGDVNGVQYFLLEPLEDGTVRLYDRYAGVVKHHIGIRAENVLAGHLKGVSGTIPFLPGTGMGGLKKKCEGRH